MKPFPLPHKRSRLERVLHTVSESVDLPGGRRRRFSVPGIGSSATRKLSVSGSAAKRAGAIAGGVVGLTAASAGVSALRSTKGTRDDS